VYRELLPVAIGIGAGTALAGVRAALSAPATLLLAVPLGFLVTVVTGEFEWGWEYLLVDVPLVAASAAAGSWAVRAARGNAWPRSL
jgi:hypothetical protein